jgi:GT2 family glycosyltransferase
MKGCCGIVLNLNKVNNFYIFSHRLSHLGIFKDIRPNVFKQNQKVYNKKIIRSQSISGGISTWCKDVFDHIQFDKFNDFHLLEDIDFSTRVFKYYSNHLYINPAVRLIHNCSPLGRDFDFTKNKRKAKELILFYKKNCNNSFAFINITWLLVCLILQSIIISFKLGKLNAIRGLFAGIKEGIKTSLKI